jgi:hypothetical protein
MPQGFEHGFIIMPMPYGAIALSLDTASCQSAGSAARKKLKQMLRLAVSCL